MPNLFTLPGPRPGPDNITQGYFPEPDAHVVIAAGVNIYGSLTRIYWPDHNHIDFTNHGTIWNISPDYLGSVLAGYYIEHFVNTGTIISETPNGNAFAFSSASGGSSVNNSGSIYAIANGNATAITHWSPDVTVTNSGLIVAYAPAATTGGGGGGSGGALGITMINGGTLHNLAGGAILAEGLAATAVSLNSGLLTNAGRIEAHALNPNYQSLAIGSGGMTHSFMRVENSGLIRADIAYLSGSEYGWSPPQQPQDQFVNLAGGEVFGDIDTRLGADFVINQGSIHGNLLMGEGDDSVDTTSGQLDGIVDMGWGEDRFRGGASDEAVAGGRDADQLEGGDGRDLLLGGHGDDLLIGGAGNDGLYGEFGNDRLVLLGGDRAVAGTGNDVIEVGDLGFALIDGGAGDDRLVLVAGPLSLDLTAALATGRLADIEAIEMAAQQRLLVRAGDVNGLAGGGEALRLYTAASSQVELIGGWAESAGVVLDGQLFRRFTLAGEVALVAGTGSVAVAAVPSAPAGGLDPVGAGAAAPLPDSAPGIGLSSATTVMTWYLLHDTETVLAEEVWRSTNGDPLLHTWGYDYSLINYGLIESSGGPGNGGPTCLSILDIDRIENHGTMRAIGVGAKVIDTPGGGGTLINYGLMEAISPQGRAEGAKIGYYRLSEVNFENFGTIIARGNAGDVAIGATVWGDDAAYNHGLITAIGGDGTQGLQISSQLMFTNRGTIEGRLAAGAGGSATATGVLLVPKSWAATTFYNYGLIHGDKNAVVIGETIGQPGITAFYNYGRLEGDVVLGIGPTLFENWGVLVGNASLGAGPALWLGAGQQGAVLGGDGTDMIVGAGAADTLNGEGGDDYLLGSLGADQLSGGAGRDVFAYRSASDSTAASFDTIKDFVSGTDRIDLSALAVQTVSIEAGAGFTQLSAVTAAGVLYLRVEGALAPSDLILTSAATVDGTAGDDVLLAGAGGSMMSGGGGNDVLIGGVGDDRLDGGFGTDVMWGGVGNDVYVVASGTAVIFELSGGGTDLVEVRGQAFDLPNNVENATMYESGVLRGNALANLLRGSASPDGMNGGDGDDILIGNSGGDLLEGGRGADMFVYLAVGDSVPDLGDEIIDFELGADRINLAAIAPTSLTWVKFKHPVNHLFYTLVTAESSAGTLQILLDGSLNLSASDFILSRVDGTAGADALTGTGGGDELNGLGGDDVIDGGAGADWMTGGLGNDTYFADDAGDKAIEADGEGYDVLAAAISYTLNAGAHVELITTGWIEGTAVIHLAGNELDQQIWGNGAANIISGNDGDDTLFGFGGADTLLGNAGKDVFFGGASASDSLYGGLGDDTYFADDAGDLIIENAGEGQDVAASSVDYALGAGASIELMTTGWIGGTFTLALTGNELGNEIWGNDGVNALSGAAGSDALIGFGGNDRLDGGGGLDLLVGGTGQDSFVFANALDGAAADIVADFSSADDTILLDDAVFAGLSLGALNANAFVTGSAALDADDRILYDAGTGKLYFDADGNGVGAAVQFAVLSGSPALAASDFVVI